MTMHGASFSLNLQTGPPGYLFPGPEFILISSTMLVATIKGTFKSIPYICPYANCLLFIITTHITGFPSLLVKSRIVNLQSLLLNLIVA